MCILFLYANGNPQRGGYKLIIVSNRDEFYARQATTAAQWLRFPHVYGGIDMEPGREGGTWLAISARDKVFKFGALLNITGEPKRKNGFARGPIVADYVSGNLSNEDYCQELVANHALYNTFNLVTVEIKDGNASIIHCSNVPPGSCTWPEGKPLGFGNSPPVNSLEKVKHGKEMFAKILEESNNDKNILVEKLMELLKNRTKYWPDDELLKRAPNWGEGLSAICVRIREAGYGSRTRSVILIDWQDKMDFYEDTMMTQDPNDEWKRTHIQQQL